ncbi:aldehyde dehydrogenase, partial [Streptomyces sp. SID7982]|nr:aldehyde dehydrogenase [Streptomyces sp. SID7982]
MHGTSSAPPALDALGTGGAYRSRNREVVHDVRGEPIAELSLVPWLFAQRSIQALRRATPPDPERRKKLL